MTRIRTRTAILLCAASLAFGAAPAFGQSANGSPPPDAAAAGGPPAGSTTDQTTATPDAATGGLSVIASTAKSAYDVDEPITLDVIIRNSGDTDAPLGSSAFDISNFHIIVLDPDSKPLTLTPYGKRLMAIPLKVTKNVPIKVQAGWQRRYDFELGRMFAMRKPGMYEITVKRTVVLTRFAGQLTPSRVGVTLISDPVAVTVGGPPPQAPAAADDAAPTSADKWAICFVRSGDIWVADANGDNQQLLIHNGEAPSWSPDKTTLVFARAGNVWLADWDGENQRQLTNWASPEAGVNPRFSPDGKWIAYRAWTPEGGIEIRTISADGKTDKSIIDDGEEPSW